MTFLHPFALIGLIAAGIPVLLHLLNLKKVRVIEFSTLSFLKELQPTTLRRLRIRQLLLLVLRTLLIVLIVLAFSRPTLKGTASTDLGARVKTTAVIAIDDSPSMERHDRSGSLWSQATDVALAILGQLQDGDEIVLLPFSAASGSSVPELLSARSLSAARSALDELKPGTVSVGLTEVLRSAGGVFGTSADAQQELYVISDFQEGLLAADADVPEEESPGGLTVRTYAIRIGEGSARNLGVTDARVINSIVEQGKPFTLSVTLTNSSPEDIDNAVVSVFLNGTRVTAKAVDVRAGTSPMFEVPVVAGAPGFVNGTVNLDDDEFPFDNTRHFSIHLRRELQVVMIGPNPSLRYLRAAIGTRSAAGPTVRLEESTADRLSSTLLQRADVLVLANASSLASSQIASVKAFLEAGGGMVYFPGPLTDGRSYQALAAALGLPDFRGLRTPNPPTERSEASPALFDVVDRQHPVFQQMFQPRIASETQRAATDPVESPRIWTHALFGPSVHSDAVVSLTDGSPFLIDHSVGAGRVMLFAVDAESDWSDLPFTGLFVPLLLRSVSYVAGEQALMPQVTAGTAPPPLDRGRISGPLTIHTPGGNSIAVSRPASYEKTLPLSTVTDIGVYDITEGTATVARFTVNGAPEESLLRPCGTEDVERAVTRAGLDRARVTWVDEKGSLARVITEARLGAELWPLAIVAALVVALLELLLGRGARAASEQTQGPMSLQSLSTTAP